MEIAKAVMLLPRVKSSMKYHFPEEIDQQCRDLCVRKHAPCNMGNTGKNVETLECPIFYRLVESVS